ncbi:hypothetical protein GIB67_004706 [Kingdonia uniflora]|uniref:Aminotransferase-like plant mobile domain-containing protein n=1 Tax=Kingdonia uniflora TaxID=39325 RepID=A0A7J7P5G3_9MAGN|nr:hypothetical protein GIB67_004706 [Kingdonia uniflora]
MSPTASNRRKIELAREGELLTYKRKRKTIDPSTVVPPNTVDTANKGVSEPVSSTESAQAAFGAQAESVQADLNAFKSLKAGGAGNSLSLRKPKEYYAYKLEKVLSNDVSARYLYLFGKDKVEKKWSWGSAVLAYMYYNLGAASRDDGKQFACCTTLIESWIFAHFPKFARIPKEMDSDAYEHCTCWKWDVSITDRYGGITLFKFREALDNYKLEDLAVLQSHQPVPDTTLAKKYEDLLAAHEDVKKKLIAKEDFIMNWTSKYKKEATRYTEDTNHLKLVHAEEMMKSLEANNSEWVCYIPNSCTHLRLLCVIHGLKK